ncbi:hypothetical protein BDV96DRAFT_605796 [Lophiotrema nucula]|uniref:Uncharacterized protein n=1 Tax=Lophiotrema nucula TaxID=690887 RepID=A0A6A5YLV3_9PLEO|nr:hypothetical protein BDV96DRAFT_605796 [Lophiotrema nucula]
MASSQWDNPPFYIAHESLQRESNIVIPKEEWEYLEQQKWRHIDCQGQGDVVISIHPDGRPESISPHRDQWDKNNRYCPRCKRLRDPESTDRNGRRTPPDSQNPSTATTSLRLESGSDDSHEPWAVTDAREAEQKKLTYKAKKAGKEVGKKTVESVKKGVETLSHSATEASKYLTGI